MANCTNNRFLKSMGRYGFAPKPIVFFALVMSIVSVNGDEAQEGDAGHSATKSRPQPSGKRPHSKSRLTKKSSGKGEGSDRKDKKEGQTAGNRVNNPKPPKTRGADSGQGSEEKGGRGGESKKPGSEKSNAAMAVGTTTLETVSDKAVVESSPSSSEPASPHGFSFGAGSGAGAQGYIECVSGIIALTMSNQEASMGVISEIPVSEGQSVRKGDILLVSSHYSIREKQKTVAELEYHLAKTDLEIAKNKSQKCKEKLGRHEKMLFSKAVSRQEFENIQKESAEADLVVEKQKISLQIAAQKVELCKDLLEQCHIRAPMDGVILAINGKVGEQSRPHEGLLIMADLTRLEIVSEVHENDISRIFIGQRAEISFPNKMPPITGYVKYISSIVRSNTLQEADPKKNQDLRVIEVRISLTDEDSLNIKNFLRMHTDVRFFGPDDDQVSRSITAVNQARAV
ncbi:MAG: HlyD family efflux transporter periplasmic adaptor subunit [Alphaproteobacteria bacterium]|nr:HlyD family efflux transporter periplasmic adaptor subunit [Alphaproteobacteria bacterium]